METQEATPLEIVSTDALNAIERGQIDMQIATAKKYPRSMKAFMDEAKSMISLNQETAESCNYRLKRKGKDGIKIIEGPSIRLLEIAASAYTNLRFGSRIIGEDDNYVTAQGFAFDVQKNVAVAVEIKRPIRTSQGMRYSVDMIGVTSVAAGSIARRNALNGGGIPRAYINELATYAKSVAIGDQKTLKERLQRAFDYFTQVMGVELERVLAYLEKPSIADCGLPEVEELQGLKTMLKDNEVKVDDVFPDPNAPKTPDLAGKGQPTPNLSEPEPKTASPAPSAPAAAAAQASTPAPAATPQTTPPPAQPATRKRTPKPAPQPEPAQPDAAAAEPPQATAPAAPVLTLVEKADALDAKLAQEGVEVGEFFDWCKSSGRDAKYKFNPDACQSCADAPEVLIDDLSANSYAGLAPCVRVFGTAAKQKK